MSVIVIEGADGSGKSEVARALAKEMGAKLIHFPDDTAVTGPAIRRFLRKEWWINTAAAMSGLPGGHKEADGLEALAFQSLQIANRMERMQEINQCVQAATLHVVLVRYWQSGWVYGQLDGLDRQWLMGVHAGMARPDLNILLDVDAATSMQRRAARDGDLPPERYEGKLDLTCKVVTLYRTLWKDATLRASFSNVSSPRSGWPVIDATQNLDAVITTAVGEVQAL